MSAYRYVAADLAYPGTPTADLPLTGVTWGRMLNGAGEFTAKLKLPPPTPAENRLLLTLWREATDRATKCIYVLRDGVPVGCYIIWNRTYNSADQTISLGGAELFSYTRRRIIEDGSGQLDPTVAPGPLRPVEIAVELITAANGANLGFDVVPAGTAISKTYFGTDVRNLADEILELAALDDGGFDFRTDIRLTPAGDFERVWVAREFLGGTTEVVAKYETNVASLRVDQRGDLRANDIIVIGPTQAGDSRTRTWRRQTTADWGPPMTLVEAHSNETESGDMLNGRAIQLQAAHRNHDLLGVEVVASAIDAQLGTFHPGDVMRLVVNAGADPFFHEGLDRSVRLLGYSVAVPDEGPGAEVVSLTLDSGDG